MAEFHGVKCTEEENRTKQSFKDECDINNIMARYVKTGRLPAMIKENPMYGDFSSVGDYHSALQIIEKAQLQFELLDVEVRDRFDNDPAKFLAFCENPKNEDEMIKLGLAVEKQKPVTPAPDTGAGDVKPVGDKK